MTTDTIRAGIYCRMSLVSMGDTTKVNDQEYICRQLADRIAWPVVDVYCDNNRSAWQRNRKRADWDRSLADVDRGHINALIVYHGDRLIRQPFDLETLLNLAAGKGVRLAAPTGIRDFDSAEDRFILRIEAAMACRESDNISRRRKAQYARWARDGRTRPGGRGGRAFGFESDGLTIVPAEADIIRELAGRMLAGESLNDLERDMAARGVLSTAGMPLGRATIRKMLARPRYAGLMPDGVSQAAWQQVLERGQWETVAGMLAARSGHYVPQLSNARRYLLSGIAGCGADGCGSPLAVRQSQGRAGRPAQKGYACVMPGCRKVYRNVRHLDLYVTGGVLQRLAESGDSAPRIKISSGIAAEMQALEQRRREAEQVIENLADRPGQRLDILARSLESFDRRLAELRDRAGTDRHARVLHAHRDVTTPEKFGALTLGTQRSLVQAAFSQIAVLPSVRRGPVFDPGRVRLVRRGGEGDSGGGHAAGDGDD